MSGGQEVEYGGLSQKCPSQAQDLNTWSPVGGALLKEGTSGSALSAMFS